MSTPTPEPTTPEPPAPKRVNKRVVYSTIAALAGSAAAITAVIILTPSHHHTLVDGPINTSAPPSAAPTPAPSATVTSPSPAPTTASPAASLPPTSVRPTSTPPSPPPNTPTPSSTPITRTAPVTRNPAIPATLSPIEQSAALAYINLNHVKGEVWDDNSADMEVFNDVAEGAELKQLVELTIQGRQQGLVSRGYAKVTKIISVTLSSDQQTATVTACLDASDTSTIVEKTGKVVGNGGPPYVDVTYMHRGVDGVWRTPGSDPDHGGQPC